MKNYTRLSNNQKVDIITRYRDEYIPTIQLAKQYGVTRQAIYKILKKSGINTSKRLILVSCTACGGQVYKNKATIRKRKHVFCNRTCYTAWLQAGNGLPMLENRPGQRIARSIISQYYNLQNDHIVHHEDQNQYNNILDNLRVFANQGDHVRYHKGYDVNPIWDGRYC